MMDLVLFVFGDVMCGVRLFVLWILLVFNVIGCLLVFEEVIFVVYWVWYLCELVCFVDGMDIVLDGGVVVLIEVGFGVMLMMLVW